MPKSKTDMHSKRPPKRDLDRILSIQTKRKLSKDFTVKYKNRTYRILKEQKVIVLTKDSVILEERLDESLHIKYKDTYLEYIDITDTIRLKQRNTEEISVTNEVQTLSRNEISNAKPLHFFQKQILCF